METSPADVFPAGSFAFSAALAQIQTDCSSDASAWRCYPYQTYADSPDDSAATFLWIVSLASSSSSSKYTISSTDNPFSPRFENVPLTLLDENQYTERLTFETSINKTFLTTISTPTTEEEGRNASTTTTKKQARCEVQDTILEATLWTRIPGTGLDGVPPTDFDAEFGTWPGRVEVRQRAGSVPICRDLEGGEVEIGEREREHEGECLCGYRNFELDEGG